MIYLTSKGTTMRRIKRALLIFAVAFALSLPGGAAVFAAITPVDIACENRGGQLPPGQQPTCQGGGLEQDTENQNPAGHAPPGQNK